MVVGQLGVLKSGGAYLTLDPEYPLERLRFRIADAQLPVRIHQFVPEGIVHIFVNDQPAGGGTTLSCRSHSPKQTTNQRHFQVGIFRNNDGVVATQFQE